MNSFPASPVLWRPYFWDYPCNYRYYLIRLSFFFSSPKAKDLVEVLTEAKQVVNPKLTEMVMCGGFNRNANKGRYGGSFGGRGRGGK